VYAAELLKLVESESVLYQRVKKVPMTVGNTLIQNYIPATSRADGQRNGQIQAYWAAEAEKYTATKHTFAQMSISLSKLTGLCYATDEVLEDAAILGSEIRAGFRDEFTFKIDDGILNGTGVTSIPKGILATTNEALVTVAAVTGQAAGTIVSANILKMWNALPARNRANAVWLINQDVEPRLIQMYLEAGVTGGVPTYLPPTGLAGAQYSTILGRPVLAMEQCAALGTKGDIVLVDPTQYQWIEKGGLRTATSIHVKFDTDETAFKFTLRANGAPIWQSSIAPYKGSTARSPYVTLAART
jgi:HK97 family phage major capsid protein